MDFNDTPEEAAYRAQARAWMAANAPTGLKPIVNEGDDLPASKAWQAKKADAGYACITWPKEWGGQGGTPIQNVIFSQEESKHQVPPNAFAIGLGMCIPAVATYSDKATLDRFLKPAMRGDEIWCQLFSEPSGGSDVGGVRTRAVQVDDGSGDWVINGQKVWTSGAQYSDYGIIICRTDPNVPKHKGMTMFWVDMKAPGIEVAPIREMSGGARFNEVFLSDVRIPDSQRLGPVGDGWKVSLWVLMNERSIVSPNRGPGWAGWDDLMEAARDMPGSDGLPVIKDGAFREKLADVYVKIAGLGHTRDRTLTAISKGQAPGPESAITKVVLASTLQDMANVGVEAADQYGVIADLELSPVEGLLQQTVMAAVGFRIAGGTDEILRNILAERVLGLPGDIRLDKDVAFKDIPTGR